MMQIWNPNPKYVWCLIYISYIICQFNLQSEKCTTTMLLLVSYRSGEWISVHGSWQPYTSKSKCVEEYPISFFNAKKGFLPGLAEKGRNAIIIKSKVQVLSPCNHPKHSNSVENCSRLWFKKKKKKKNENKKP